MKDATQISVVKRGIAKDKLANEFLKRLGITEPDVVAEVLEEILPLYLNVDVLPSASEHSEHIKTILVAWSTDSITKRERLGQKLRETPFVRYHCRTSGVQGYAEPNDVYFPDEDLLEFFEGSEDAKFIVTSYSKDARDMLAKLGVVSIPRCFVINHGEQRHRAYSTRGAQIVNY